MTGTPSCCPRCRAGEIRAVAHSPVAGCWVVYSCPACWYAWRSTEPPEATDPDRYPESFRLRAEDVGTAPRML